MALTEVSDLRATINRIMPQQGGPPKVTGPVLNGVLQRMITLADTSAMTYEEVIHFPGQPLFQDTVFEPSQLLAVVASAGVEKLELCVGEFDEDNLRVVPTTGELPEPLDLPAGPLTYRLTFDPGVHYAAIKQIIKIQ